MKRMIALGLITVLACSGSVVLAHDETEADEVAEKREKLDGAAAETLDELSKNAEAQELLESAYGYAVFTTMKFALGVSGGGGSGVAVNKNTGDRTYMKMGTAGVGLGLGGKKYSIAFLFETEKAFTSFVEKGWQADASANATAGTEGAAVATTFHNGLAIFQFTKKGLMAHADVAGTKYWKSGELN